NTRRLGRPGRLLCPAHPGRVSGLLAPDSPTPADARATRPLRRTRRRCIRHLRGGSGTGRRRPATQAGVRPGVQSDRRQGGSSHRGAEIVETWLEQEVLPPIHLERYDRYVAAMNGAEQNYHHADVFESGLQSPLLRLLNARYLILPAVAAQDQVVPRTPEWSLVAFQDDSALVLENPAALPRSWIVHAG